MSKKLEFLADEMGFENGAISHIRGTLLLCPCLTEVELDF